MVSRSRRASGPRSTPQRRGTKLAGAAPAALIGHRFPALVFVLATLLTDDPNFRGSCAASQRASETPPVRFPSFSAIATGFQTSHSSPYVWMDHPEDGCGYPSRLCRIDRLRRSLQSLTSEARTEWLQAVLIIHQPCKCSGRTQLPACCGGVRHGTGTLRQTPGVATEAPVEVAVIDRCELGRAASVAAAGRVRSDAAGEPIGGDLLGE
ncbi:unnamed protein product [Urochloa humidicola]